MLPVQVPQSRPPSRGVVICFGDSLTVGNGGEATYPKILEGLLREAGHNLCVHNAGNWGDTSEKMIARLPRAISEGARQGSLECILVLGGTNDILLGNAGASSIFSNLQRLHEIAGNAPYMPRVGVFTIPPTKSSGSRQQVRLELNKALQQVCLHKAPGWTPQGRKFFVDLDTLEFSLSSDGVHYTAEGYLEIARRVFQAMKPFLATPPPGPNMAAVKQ